jgi:hypothetical protein
MGGAGGVRAALSGKFLFSSAIFIDLSVEAVRAVVPVERPISK